MYSCARGAARNCQNKRQYGKCLTTIFLAIFYSLPAFGRHAVQDQQERSVALGTSKILEICKTADSVAPTCEQFDLTKNGNSVWSPKYWHVRAVGSHLIRQRLRKQTDPIYKKIRETIQGAPDELMGLLQDPEREPVKTAHVLGKFLEGNQTEKEKLEPLLKNLPAIVKVGVIDQALDGANSWLDGRLAADIDPKDVNSAEEHAVHVAGIIGGRWPLGIGLYAEIHPYNILSKDRREIGPAYEKAKKEVDLTNGSWGYGLEYNPSPKEIQSFQEAVSGNGYGTIHFMAAGNDGDTEISGSTYGESVIKVGSLTPTGDRSFFSSIGDELFLMGFGHDIWSAHASKAVRAPDESDRQPFARAGTNGIPFDRVRFNGTSMASPSVVGAVSNWKSILPDLSGQEIREIIAGTSILSPKADSFLEGKGQINGYRGFRLAEKLNTYLKSLPLSKSGTDEKSILEALKSGNLREKREALHALSQLKGGKNLEHSELVQNAESEIRAFLRKANDFKDEADGEFKDALSKLNKFKESRSCKDLEDAVMGMERAYSLDPRRSDIVKDLALLYSSIGLSEDAIRIYGRIANPQDAFSEADYQVFSKAVEKAKQSSTAQVLAAAYKIQLRHSGDNSKKLELFKESLQKKGVASFLGEILPKDIYHSIGSVSPRQALEFVNILKEMDLPSDSPIIKDMRAFTSDDPIVHYLVQKSIDEKTGQKTVHAISIDDYISKFKNPGFKKEVEEILFGKNKSSPYWTSLFEEVFPKLSKKQRKDLFTHLGDHAADFTGKLIQEYLLLKSKPEEYAKTLKDLGVVVPDKYLFSKDRYSEDSQKLVLTSHGTPFWTASHSEVEDYLKISSEKKLSDFMGDRDFAKATWNKIFNDSEFRNKNREFFSKFANELDTAYKSSKQSKEKDKCQEAAKEAGVKMAGFPISYTALENHLCPFLYRSKSELEWIKSLTSYACLSERAISEMCGGGGGEDPQLKAHSLDPAIPPIITDAEHLVDLIQMNGGKVVPFSWLPAQKEKALDILLSSERGRNLLTLDSSQGRDSLVNSLLFAETKSFDVNGEQRYGALERFAKKAVAQQGTLEREYFTILSKVSRDNVTPFIPYQTHSDKELRENEVKADRFFNNWFEMLHESLSKQGKKISNLRLLEGSANAPKDYNHLVLEWEKKPSHAESIPDWMFEMAAGLHSSRLKEDVRKHPEFYSKEVIAAVEKLPDFNVAALNKDVTKTHSSEQMRLEAAAEKYIRFRDSTQTPPLLILNQSTQGEWEDWFARVFRDGIEGNFDYELPDKIRAHFVKNLRNIQSSEEFSQLSPFLTRILSKYVFPKEYGMSTKGGAITFDRDKETKPLFKPSELSQLYELGKKFPLMYLITDLSTPLMERPAVELPKDLSILSLQDMKDVFSWPVTEENHTRFQRLLLHIEERIESLRPEVRQYFLKKYHGFSKTNLWK